MRDEEKKVYITPELVEYGAVIKLTGSWSSDWLDGVSGGRNKGMASLEQA